VKRDNRLWKAGRNNRFSRAINNLGWIAANSSDGHAYLLIPAVPTFQNILDFYDRSVNEGTLSGVGPNPHAANGRLWALRNMIVQAQVYKEAGYNDLASNQLQDAYNKTDRLPNPLDFFSGQASSQLARMILELKASLSSP
jgi:hypothetical protein